MRLARFCQAALRPFRLLLVAFTFALLLFSQVAPVYADNIPFYSSKSSPTKGEDVLKGIEAKSWDVIEAGGPYDMEKTKTEANKGINEVQGDADKDKMYNPATSRNAAPAVEQTVKKNLENLQDAAKDLVD
jgi:hypothetical protein